MPRLPNDLAGWVAVIVAAIGIAGFAFHFVVNSLPGRLLDRIELPNSLGATRVTAPDGRVFVASEPFGRVQRYGPSGFELGFAVDARGGAIEAGMSRDGNLLICSGRAGHVLITYDAAGREIGERQPCQPSSAHDGRIPGTPGYPSHAQVPAIAQSWLALLAVPLWHPYTGWGMAAVAVLYLRLRRRTADA